MHLVQIHGFCFIVEFTALILILLYVFDYSFNMFYYLNLSTTIIIITVELASTLRCINFNVIGFNNNNFTLNLILSIIVFYSISIILRTRYTWKQ